MVEVPPLAPLDPQPAPFKTVAFTSPRLVHSGHAIDEDPQEAHDCRFVLQDAPDKIGCRRHQ